MYFCLNWQIVQIKTYNLKLLISVFLEKFNLFMKREFASKWPPRTFKNSVRKVSFWHCATSIFCYRVSHETWQLVNGFECSIYYIRYWRLLKVYFVNKLFYSNIFYFEINFLKMTAMLYFLLFSFVSMNLTNYGRRHLKLFTNCHVSWDTL